MAAKKIVEYGLSSFMKLGRVRVVNWGQSWQRMNGGKQKFRKLKEPKNLGMSELSYRRPSTNDANIDAIDLEEGSGDSEEDINHASDNDITQASPTLSPPFSSSPAATTAPLLPITPTIILISSRQSLSPLTVASTSTNPTTLFPSQPFFVSRPTHNPFSSTKTNQPTNLPSPFPLIPSLSLTELVATNTSSFDRQQPPPAPQSTRRPSPPTTKENQQPISHMKQRSMKTMKK
uniref:Uncharacterized protein n=1 Tax=Salix viminalis TaxID=40686 RepID=A0A6N2L995_SALVM